MECSYLIDQHTDDCETWEDSCKTSYVVSKTVHICSECGKKMFPGEQYLLEIVRWDGYGIGTKRYKTCCDCESIRNHLCCSWIYGSVLEDVETEFELIDEDEYPWSSFAKLTPGAKAFVFEIIEKVWNLDGDE